MSYLKSWSCLAIVTIVLPFVAGTCNKFDVTREYFSRTGGPAQIISKGFVCDTPNSNYSYERQQRCNRTTECPTSSFGVVNTIGTNNLSLTKDQVLPLYNLVAASTPSRPVTFLYSLSGNPGNISSCLKAKQANETFTPAGYWLFTPIYLCVEGTLSQCTNGPVEDGTGIEICGVKTFGQEADSVSVDGVIGFVSTDPETAANLTSNPAETVTPVAREPASTTDPTTSGSAAGSSPTPAGAERVGTGQLLGGLVLAAWALI